MYSDKILKYIDKNKLIEDNDHILVAVSAGPDSMCLMHYLSDLKQRFFPGLELSVAHVNHRTRGQENDLEEKLIETYCRKLNVNFYRTDFYFSQEANFHHESHHFRYDFFSNIALKIQANKIALAHHLDDQIETILFRLMRGTNLKGYSGMKHAYAIRSNLEIIRPFLELYKDDILNYCKEYAIPFLNDSSNAKNTYTRNKIRNLVIPQLSDIQSDLKEKIVQFKDQLDEANELIEQIAREDFNNIYHENDDHSARLNLTILKSKHRSIIRWVVIHAINTVTNNDLELSYHQVNQIIDNIFNQKPNIEFDLGHQFQVVKEYDALLIRKLPELITPYQVEINDFKEYILPNQVKLNVKIIEEKVKFHNKKLFLCYNKSMWPLFVRTPKPGDRIETKIGHKKLNRIFINKKVPKHEREQWPIITDKDDRILWVIGLEKSSILEGIEGSGNVVIEVKNWRSL